jgi:hypothetical protein
MSCPVLCVHTVQELIGEAPLLELLESQLQLGAADRLLLEMQSLTWDVSENMFIYKALFLVCATLRTADFFGPSFCMW